MVDIYPPAVQRPELLKLAEALGCRDNALRRDECGDWRINGKHGHVYAIPGTLTRRTTPGFHFFVMNWTAKGWNSAQRGLSTFMETTNGGDDEGAMFLNRLPTEKEAVLIRHWLGIAKKAEFSPEVLARKRESMSKAGQKIARRPALDGPRVAE